MTALESSLAEDYPTTEFYRAAIENASDSDREFAGTLAVSVIDVVKAFGAVKGRLHGSGQDGVDFGLLIRLAKAGPMRASDLSEQLCADPSTVSRQVAGLVKAGLIERKADPKDGRASILVPTEAGLARVTQFVKMRGQVFVPLVAHWSAEEREVFARLMADFAATLNTNLEAAKNVATELIQHGALRRNA